MEKEQRLVVITGGSRGIGRAIALRFAKENPRIVIIHYDPDETYAEETLGLLKARGVSAEAFKVDVSSFTATKELFDGLLNDYGKVDVLINNAGIIRDTFLMRMTEEDWDRVINVNLKSVFNCSRAVIRAMIRESRGWIVNISSVVATIGNPGQTNYGASKGGIISFTKSLAREVAGKGIHVNAVAPGFVLTDMTEPLPEKVKEAFLQQIPMKRPGKPEDIAGVVYWLCSEDADYITGQTIHVNGGMFMS